MSPDFVPPRPSSARGSAVCYSTEYLICINRPGTFRAANVPLNRKSAPKRTQRPSQPAATSIRCAMCRLRARATVRPLFAALPTVEAQFVDQRKQIRIVDCADVGLLALAHAGDLHVSSIALSELFAELDFARSSYFYHRARNEALTSMVSCVAPSQISASSITVATASVGCGRHWAGSTSSSRRTSCSV